MDRTMAFSVLSSVGLLALSIGAFGVLDTFNRENLYARRVDWLVALFAAGVLLNVAAYTFSGRWYIAAPLALLLLPADRAIQMRRALRRRRADLDTFNGTRSD